MSLYLLDTNTCVQYLRNRNARVIARFKSRQPLELNVCGIVKAELYYGAFRSARPTANLALLTKLFATVGYLAFNDAAAETHGRLRADLASRGTPIGPYDSLIAATALVHGAILVSHNVAEFGRVPGLTVEDWETP